MTQTLLNALKNNNISHAYLFCGPRGTGKTSTGRILAKAINCLDNGRGEPCNTCDMCRAITEDRAMDVIEIDAASNRGIDDVRELREKVNYAPSQARRKVYIIDEFHMLTKEASNALLKTLEEPPPHVVFVLATTESHKVMATILSRCQHFDFHRLSRADVVNQLKKIAFAENISIDTQSLQLIARSTTGSLRDAENLLQQLTTYFGSSISFQQVQTTLGITGDWRAKEIVKNIIQNDLTKGMAALNAVNNDGLDLRQFNREMVEYLRNLLLIKTGAADAVDLTEEDIAELKQIANQASLEQVLNAVKLFGQISLGNDNSILPLELALVDCYLANTQGKSESPASPETRMTAPKPGTTPPARPVSRPAAAAPSQASHEAHPTYSSPSGEKKSPKESPPAPVSKEGTVDRSAEESPSTLPPAIKEAPPQTPSLSSDIERLRLNWQQLLENVPANLKRTNAVAYLRSGGKPVSIENETVVLSLKYDIHKSHMEKPENQKVAEKIISDFLGYPCKIRCVCEAENNNHLVRKALKEGAQIISVEEK